MSRQYNSHTAPSSLRRASSASDAAANNSALASAASNAASAANGNGTTHNGGGSSSDLYQQLIDSNDLVKELDDIEAISQQISQHAEVLYQNWKSNSLPRTGGGGGGGGGSTSLTTLSNNSNNPSSNQEHQSTNPQRAVSSSSTTYGAGVGFPKRPIIENGYSNGSPPPLSASSTISNNRNGNGSHYGGGNHHPHHNPSLEPLQPPQHHHQISGGVGDVKKGGSVGGGGSASPLSSPTSTLTSPSFINKTLPRSNSSGSGESPHHSSTTGATTSSASKLDLLTSPVVNGNLKDLVNSFVSTDRAKQAARQTISQTISNQMNRKSHQPNHHQFMRSPSPSNSAISASSTGSSFSSRGMSPPLRSPMLASSLGGQTSAGPGVVPSLPTSERRLMDAFPSNASIMNNVHTKMPPLFSTASITGGNGNNQNSNSTIGDPSSAHQQPLTISTTITPEQQQQILPPKWPQDQTDQVGGHGQHQVIRIPVQHLPSSSSSSTSSIMDSAATNTSSANPPAEANLRSPTILHQMSSSSTPPSSSTTSAAGTTSIPSLHAAHVENMKKRFEEAKERINAMHQRATSGLAPFMGHPDPFADELDFFSRNRSRPQRPLVAPPHPELTPQQKQHISERSSPANLANSVNAAGVNPNIAIAGGVQPPKRFGGSVAERVMIFERCPIFGDGTMVSGLKEPRMPALLLNSKQTSAAAMNMIPVHTSNISSAPWRNLQQESMGKIQERECSPDYYTQSRPFESGWQVPLYLSRPRFVSKKTPRVAKVRDIPIATSTSTTTSTTSFPPPTIITPPPTTTTASTTTSPSPSTITTTPSFLSTPSPPNILSTSRGSSASTSPASTLSRLSRPPSIIVTGKEKVLPKFHFPLGNPATAPPSDLTKFADEFCKHQNSAVNVEELGQVLKACGYPFYWKAILFSAAGGEKTGLLSYVAFSDFWRKMCATHHDEAAQFMHILSHHKSRTHVRTLLTPEDFVPLVQDVVDSHPGLGFLKEATEFHSRYVHTVIARIFFVVNRSWSGLITLSELRKSNLLATIRILEEEEDINQITDFFSYEHFYVIYCKFWELDKDHDLFIDREDLSRHNDHAISARMIDRIFSGAVTRGVAQKEGKMSYTEFVWFLLAEEDKRNSTSIEYWFRSMDLDGDGYLSMYELEYFYEEQLQRMEQLGIETLPFEDCLCQMLDMIMPKKLNVISLQDLKRCRMTPIFFDTFFNLEKYLDHEQRDPFASQRDVDEDGNEMSDWDRFAAEEYELLVAEEGNADGMDGMDEMGLEDDPDGHAEMQLEQALDDNDLVYHDTMITAQ